MSSADVRFVTALAKDKQKLLCIFTACRTYNKENKLELSFAKLVKLVFNSVLAFLIAKQLLSAVQLFQLFFYSVPWLGALRGSYIPNFSSLAQLQVS